jgi:hypothetical protein
MYPGPRAIPPVQPKLQSILMLGRDGST